MMRPIRMENWHTTRENYPDEAGAQLVGDIEREGGGTRHVITSPIVEVAGRLLRTRSGTWYELGTVDAEFLAFMQSHNYAFDPENPIRLVKKLTELPDRRAN